VGGFFGIASKGDCVGDLFYGTDYHSHLGTKRGGLAVHGRDGFARVIHSIENDQFRSKFDPEVAKLEGRSGIGVISDTDSQPLLIQSHLGRFAIVTVGAVKNAEQLIARAFQNRRVQFSEIGSGQISPTELVALLINQEESFEAGIAAAQKLIQGPARFFSSPRMASTRPAIDGAARRSCSGERKGAGPSPWRRALFPTSASPPKSISAPARSR
jgi:amidophosphoribosyltransferase